MNSGKEEEHMRVAYYEFLDMYHHQVRLSLDKTPVHNEPGHVLAICRYEGKWLLTKHRSRGLEFPGGKIEKGETPEEAVKREVLEETGGLVSHITYIGQYEVDNGENRFRKNIYFVQIDDILPLPHYMETDGPLLIKDFPETIRQQEDFSFIMKDDLLPTVLNEIKEKHLL